MTQLQLSIEWGRLVLTAPDGPEFRRAIDRLDGAGLTLSPTRSNDRRDGLRTARSKEATAQAYDAVRTAQWLSSRNIAIQVSAGVVSGARYDASQSVQRTLFSVAAASVDDDLVDEMAHRYGYRRVGEVVVAQGRGGVQRAFAVVEVPDVDEGDDAAEEDSFTSGFSLIAVHSGAPDAVADEGAEAA